jgi:hypothetical protein
VRPLPLHISFPTSHERNISTTSPLYMEAAQAVAKHHTPPQSQPLRSSSERLPSEPYFPVRALGAFGLRLISGAALRFADV